MSKTRFQTKELLSPLSCLKLISLFILFPLFLSSQSITSLTLENTNNKPLVGATFSSADGAFSDITDLNGVVNIPTNIEAKIRIKYLGFLDVVFFLDDYKSGDVIVMQPTEFLIDELTIVGRTNVRKDELPYQIETISQSKIKFTNPQTSADALASHANVFVQKSQGGGGSPILRGFEANKILLVVDGVRLNNAIYRSGHLQNAITIDPAMLERMEVIYGAGSLTYGSDALGGVVHFRSKRPQLNFSKKKISIDQNYGLRYANVNFEKNLHYDLNIGGKKWASLTSISHSDFNDLHAGVWRNLKYPDFGIRPNYVTQVNGIDSIVANPSLYKQIGTAYAQTDVMQKILLQFNDHTNLIINGQYSTSSDIQRYDMLTETDSNGDLEFAEWAYGPQNRLLISGQFDFKKSNKIFDQSKIILSYQRIDEDRITRKYKSVIRNEQNEDVGVYGITIDALKNINATNSFRYGFDYQYNNVSSTAWDQNIETGNTDNNVLTRYPSNGSQMQTAGIYGQYTWKNLSGSIISNTGVRYNYSQLDLKYKSTDPFAWPQSFIDGLSSKQNSLVASTGINLKLNQNWRGHAQIANAFRAPNVDDLAKIRIKSGEVSVPNLNLIPEKSINSEIGITRILNSQSHLNANAYYTLLKDAIVRDNYPSPNGSSTIINGLDTLTTVANVNASSGKVYGCSVNLSLGFGEHFEFKGSYNYTIGKSKNDSEEDKPLAHIPPYFGRMAINYNYNFLEVSTVMKYNGRKRIEDYGGSEDNPEKATPEGALSWQTYNIYVGYQYNPLLKLHVGVENIFDIHYRNFASGVSAPGRNFIISLSGNF